MRGHDIVKENFAFKPGTPPRDKNPIVKAMSHAAALNNDETLMAYYLYSEIDEVNLIMTCEIFQCTMKGSFSVKTLDTENKECTVQQVSKPFPFQASVRFVRCYGNFHFCFATCHNGCQCTSQCKSPDFS